MPFRQCFVWFESGGGIVAEVVRTFVVFTQRCESLTRVLLLETQSGKKRAVSHAFVGELALGREGLTIRANHR